MRNEAQFLKSSLEEHGLVADEVTYERDTNLSLDRFTVRKNIGGETFHHQVTLTDEATLLSNGKEKTLAMYAKNIVDAFEDETVDTIEMGRRRVEVSPYDGGWAECKHCGSSVELPENKPARFREDAEFSMPNPLPQDRESVVASLSGTERIALEFYLLGKLRNECDDTCPNARYDMTERFKYL